MGTHRVIKRRAGLARFELRELWAHRELLAFLVWRDLLVRYKQTAFGILWALARPVVIMAIFTLVFGKIARLPSDGLPYPLLILAALLPWQYFATAVSDGSNSLVGSASMISRVYFPRLIIPLSAVVAAAAEFLVSLGLFALLAAYYGVQPSRTVVWLPALFLLTVLAAAGLSIWFSALYVRFRDVRHLLPFLIQAGAFISPIGFSTAIVPERWRFLYSLNPLVGIIEGFRAALLGTANAAHPWALPMSAAAVVLVLITGTYYFKAVERSFADVI